LVSVKDPDHQTLIFVTHPASPSHNIFHFHSSPRLEQANKQAVVVVVVVVAAVVHSGIDREQAIHRLAPQKSKHQPSNSPFVIHHAVVIFINAAAASRV
jgi:hypothetical protein